MYAKFMSAVMASIFASLIISPIAAASTMMPLSSEPEKSKAMTFYKIKRCSALHWAVGKMLEGAELEDGTDASAPHMNLALIFHAFAVDQGLSHGSNEDVVNGDIEAIAINYFKIWKENSLLTGHNFESVTISDLEYCQNYWNELNGK